MKNFDEIMKKAEASVDSLVDERERRKKYMDKIHKPFKEFVEKINERYPTQKGIPSHLKLREYGDYSIPNDGIYFRYEAVNLDIGDIVFSICPNTDGTLSYWLTIDGDDNHQYLEPLMERVAELVIKKYKNIK
jgi:hypothetical protein